MKQNEAPDFYFRIGRIRVAVWLTELDGQEGYALRFGCRTRPHESLESVIESAPDALPEIAERIDTIVSLMRKGILVPGIGNIRMPATDNVH